MVLVVTGVISIDLLAQECREIFGLSTELGRKKAELQAHENIVQVWQQYENTSDTGLSE